MILSLSEQTINGGKKRGSVMMLPEMKGVTTPGTQGTEKSHTEFKGKSVTFEMGLKGLVRIF